MAKLLLEIVEGDGAGSQIALGGTVELGRDPALPDSLDDAQVSRRHARISLAGDRAQIEDLGSTNGTYVNDEPIAGPRELEPGDRLRIGLTVFELRTEEDTTVRGSAVGPTPPVTRIGADVLEPASEGDLVPVRAEAAEAPDLIAEAGEPGFIARSAVRAELGGESRVRGDGAARGDADALARLVDARVERRTGVAAFAVLAIAGLAVAILLGAR